MYKRILEYAGRYKKYTYSSIAFTFIAVLLNALPFLIVYQLIAPLLGYGEIGTAGIVWRLIAIAACVTLYALLYPFGLRLSHIAAFNTLKNLRISLQKRLEKLPLGVIQEKGTGTIKKMFVEDIEAMELLLAHAIPEGISNIRIKVFTSSSRRPHACPISDLRMLMPSRPML